MINSKADFSFGREKIAHRLVKSDTQVVQSPSLYDRLALDFSVMDKTVLSIMLVVCFYRKSGDIIDVM